jgi:hypothetical protein
VNLGAEAVAGLEKITANMAVCNGILDPFALPPGPNNGLKDLTGNFGYINGVVYELRFPGSSGRGCSDYGLTSVPGNFGFADPDGCGNSATCLSNSLLDPTPGGDCVKISLAALNAIGDTVVTENAALTAFQERFDQDTNSAVYGTFPTYNSGYVTSATNGRRVIRVSFTDGPPGGSGRYNVIGFGCFFMAARPDASPPASSICLMYVGKCGESGAPVATPTLNTSSPGLTRWVLFR